MLNREKFYKTYRMFGYDYLFYSTIMFLFVTITKGMSVGEYMYLCSIYAVFFAIFQIPSNYLVESIGIKKSMVIGNLLCMVHCVIYIFLKKFIFLAIAEMFCALGFALKGLTETQWLYAILKKNGTTSKYAKVEGKGVSRYYFFEGITSLFIGYFFTVNNYIPIILTLACLTISFLMSTQFENVEVNLEDDYSGLKSYLREFKKVLKSQRLISIFIYAFFITGFIEVVKTLQKSVIVELDVSPTIYAIILSAFTLCVGIGSRTQDKIEKTTKKKTLTVIALSLTLGILIVGILNYGIESIGTKLLLSIIILCILNLSQGIYRISIKKYLNNFTTSSVRGKILAIFYIFEGLGKSILLFISGMIVDNIGTTFTCILSGAIMCVLMSVILVFMKTRLGLEPDEYNKSDLCGKTVSELTK